MLTPLGWRDHKEVPIRKLLDQRKRAAQFFPRLSDLIRRKKRGPYRDGCGNLKFIRDDPRRERVVTKFKVKLNRQQLLDAFSDFLYRATTHRGFARRILSLSGDHE